MPPLPVVPRTIKYSLRYSDSGNTNVENVFYQTFTQPPGSSDATSLAATVTAQWLTHVSPLMGTWMTLISATVNDLSSTTGAVAVNVTGGAGTAAAGAHLSSGAATVIQTKIARKYRGGHSRIYLPGAGQNDLQTTNTWTTSYITAVAAGWAAFVNGIITNAPVALGAMQNVVAHRYGRCASPPCSPAPDEDAPSVPLASPYTDAISAWSVNPRVGSQRRRNQQGS